MTPVLYMCDCITILAVKTRLTLTSMRELCVEGLAMSTRVALPMYVGCRMSELRRQLLPSPTPSQDRTAQVRKNLFGPIDHEENIKFVQDELDKISQADCQRWNFDFQAEKPKEGRYSWVSVDEGVPQAYEMSRLTYLTSHAAATTTTAVVVAPTPVRKVPEGGGGGSPTAPAGGGGGGEPSTSTPQTTTSTPTSTTSTATVLDKPTSQTTTRLSTSSASPTSASEAATSKSISEVVVKKLIGDSDKLEKIEKLPVLRCTRSRSSQPPLTAFMKIQKTKRRASTKLEDEQPPALVKRPRTTSS